MYKLQCIRGDRFLYVDVPISVEHIGKLRGIVSGIDAIEYQVENVPGKVIKEIINKRIKEIFD